MKITLTTKTFAALSFHCLTLAGSAALKPYRVAEAQSYCAGSAAGNHYLAGAAIGQYQCSGPITGQCHG